MNVPGGIELSIITSFSCKSDSPKDFEAFSKNNKFGWTFDVVGVATQIIII